MMRLMICKFVVILLVSTVDSQVASQATPYLPSLHNSDPSYVPVVVALGCTFLFVVFFAIYLRRCTDIDTNLTVTDLPVAAITATNSTTVNYSPHVPQGIDPTVVDSFPILMYSNLGGSNVPDDCAVCLAEFMADDMLRLIPRCGHVFHPDCIKTWLASKVTCPVCRAVLTLEEEVAMVVIRDEAIEPPEEEEVGDGSAARRSTTTAEVSWGDRGLRRCHSTGHSLDLRLREDSMRREIVGWCTPTNCHVFQRHEEEGSSRGGRFFIPQ